MKCTFTIGQRVVCINDDWPEWALLAGTSFVVPGEVRVPMINEVLTIKEIVPVESPILIEDAVALLFHEINGGWAFQNFRPLMSGNTDISIFKAMLKPAGKVKADA